MIVTLPRLLAAACALTAALAVLGYTAVLGTDGLTWLAVSATCAVLALILSEPRGEL